MTMQRKDRDLLGAVIAVLCAAVAALAIHIALIMRADAAELPVSAPTSSCPGYSSPDEAAIAALARAAALDPYHEYAGALFKQGGRYCFTFPVSNAEEETFTVRIAFPRTARLVGLYHTHPAGPHSKAFSPADVATASSMRVVSYIYCVADHAIRRFDPARDETRPLDRDDLQRRFSPGTILITLRR